MKKTVRVFCFIAVLICSPSSLSALTLHITATVERQHGPIRPGQTIGFLIRHGFGREVLTTIKGHFGSTTILYTVDQVGPYGAIICAYNYGRHTQNGSFIIAYWDIADDFRL